MITVQSKLEGMLNETILDTIEDILLDIFGKRSFNVILEVVKENYSLNWKDVPGKAQVFAEALNHVLGVGSIIIQDLIIESLCIKLNTELKWKKAYRFSDYIDQLRFVYVLADP